MKEKFKKGYEVFLEYYMYFLGASVVGWVYEVLTIMLENHHGFQNRGVLFGPYLPIYGFGMIILIFTVNPIRNIKGLSEKSKVLDFILKLVLVFIGTFIVTSLVELIASYMISPTSWTYKKDGTGTSLWYYSKNEGYGINFQGRIALKSSLRFGLGGTVLLYAVKPLIEKMTKNKKVFLVVGSILLALFLLDSIMTFVF